MGSLKDWDEAARLRTEIMTQGLDLARLRGLEIGPLSHPVVRRSQGAVTYVDYADAETLRRMYAGGGHVDAAAIVEVDAVWGERSLAQCLDGSRVDYVMASHVAEHVPDLVTWLGEIAEVLKPGGELRLTLPDSRFSHDWQREETRFTDLVAAWLLRARRPQVRDVLDFRLQTTSAIDCWDIFHGRADLSHVPPDHAFWDAVGFAVTARDQPDVYCDVHCLVARPRTFARLMQRLAAVGLLKLRCARMIDTEGGVWEYYVFLTPCEDAAEVERSWRDVQATLHDPLPGSAAARAAEAASAAAAAQARALAESEAERARLATQLQRAETQLRALRRSWSWRLTAPLRAVRAAAR